MMQLIRIEYGETNPFGEIFGKPKHLDWPVDAYRITLPKVSKDNEKNPFELVILKIIAAGGSLGAEALAQETCLPIDLVRIVLTQLQEKSYLDKHYKIIDRSRGFWEDKHKHAIDYISAYLFREIATGKILPFVHLLDNDNPLKRNDIEKESDRKIRYETEHRGKPPTPRDLIAALRIMKKRTKAFSAGYNNEYLPKVSQITITAEPEQYYLDCPIAIQKSDGEFRIADPFGTGFSLVLENAFQQLLAEDTRLSEWFLNWKQRLSIPRQVEQVTFPKEPFDNETNQRRYPKLVAMLRIERHRQYRTISQIYGAIEWALFYSCAQRQYSTAVNRLENTNQNEHHDLLNKAAENIGLNQPREGFYPVTKKRLEDFKEEKAEMGTVLRISLLMAENEVTHPLRQIAVKYQDFISRINAIKKKERDPLRHGQGRFRKIEIELPEEAFMREVVSALLPTVQFSGTFVVKVDEDNVADYLLDARSGVQGEFGFRHFNQLGTGLQDRLIYAERFWLSWREGDDARSFVDDIYASLQMAFRQRLFGNLPPDIKDPDFIKIAEENASLSGLGMIPESLRTVKKDFIRQTLHGDDKSPGACAIVFLLISDTETLRSVADADSDFISNIADIISTSDHGNEPLPLSKDEIDKLRKSAYSVIKILMEY